MEDPARFDWANVDVWVSPEGEALIAQRDYLDDTFCGEQKVEQRGFEKEFKQVLKRRNGRTASKNLLRMMNRKDGSSTTLCAESIRPSREKN